MDSRAVRLAAVLILLCAALLRTYALDRKSLEDDEVFTLGVAASENSLFDVVSISLAQYHASKPPLYFLITHSFLRLEDHDFLLRFPSMAFGVLGVAATYAVGAALFGRKEGLAAAFLLCASPLHIRLSQWARFYTLLMMSSSLSLYFLYRGMREGRARSWAGFIATSVLNLYNHLFAFLVLLSQSLFFVLAWLRGLMIFRREQGIARAQGDTLGPKPWVFADQRSIFILMASLAIIGVAYLPMAPHLLVNLSGPRGVAAGAKTPGLELSLPFIRGLLGEWSTASGTALWIFLFLFCIGFLVSLRDQRTEILLVLLWIGAPFAVLFAMPMKQRFYPRYVVFMLPIYLVAVARGLTACADLVTWMLQWIGGEKWVRSWMSLALCFALLGALSVSPLESYYEERINDWKAVATFLGNVISEGEGIIVRRPRWELALSHYDGRFADREFSVMLPRDSLSEGFQYEQGVWFVGREGRSNKMSRLEGELAALTEGQVFKMIFEGRGDHRMPGAGEMMFWDVWVLYVRHDLDNAQLIKLYGQALETVPLYGTAYVHTALGDLLVKESRLGEAIEHYQAAIRLAPLSPEPHYGLALAYQHWGLHDQAVLEWRTYEELTREE